MFRLPRCSLSKLSSPLLAKRGHARSKTSMTGVDATGIPLTPTWSVHELLSSYPRPTIAPATLKRLHELAGLVPPLEGSIEHGKITREMEELVKLVEAVKLVDVGEVKEDGTVPDGRIWASGEGVEMAAEPLFGESNVDRRTLLAHASRTLDGLYVVETDKSRR